MSYYLVKCKFGHVGRDKYLPLVIALVAESMKEASLKARNMGGVKRDHKDWCLERPYEVDYDHYETARRAYKNDIYFKIHCRSRLFLLKGRLVAEPNYIRMNGIKKNTVTYRKYRDKSIIGFKRKKEKVVIESLSKYQITEISNYKNGYIRMWVKI